MKNDHLKLLVEGRDDLHVVANLLHKHGLENRIHIEEKNGFPNLRDSIKIEVIAPERQTLGIIADANDNPLGRWKSISKQLVKADCQVPENISSSGSIFEGPRNKRVGVWLMPDNQRSGELEDFVYDIIPEHDPVLPQAEKYIDNIPAKDRKFRDTKLKRAYVHAWLAARKKPRPMGTAIQSGDLVHNTDVAEAFVSWLRKLFQL